MTNKVMNLESIHAFFHGFARFIQSNDLDIRFMNRDEMGMEIQVYDPLGNDTELVTHARVVSPVTDSFYKWTGTFWLLESGSLLDKVV